MKTIGFFNSKGGVGKTLLVYHVAWMLSELGVKVIAADLDPQANLTSMFLDEPALDAIWERQQQTTIYRAVAPLFRGTGDVAAPSVEQIDDEIGLLLGDLRLSELEDRLAAAWLSCTCGEEHSFQLTGALTSAIAAAGRSFGAELILVDTSPSLGALNRSVLLGCDFVIMPLGVDLFSPLALQFIGMSLGKWRDERKSLHAAQPVFGAMLPGGKMAPIGYVVVRQAVFAGRLPNSTSRWLQRIPVCYHTDILNETEIPLYGVDDDPHCLAVLKDRRSLISLAQEARKPMFSLLPADGAFGGHQTAVRECYDEFRELSRRIMRACGLG